MTVADLATKLDVKAKDVLRKLMDRRLMMTINSTLDDETASMIAREFGADVKMQTFEEEMLQVEAEDVNPADLVTRATRAERVVRHDWSVGDMVIWDNTGVLHRVTGHDPTSTRELHRATRLDESPVDRPAHGVRVFLASLARGGRDVFHAEAGRAAHGAREAKLDRRLVVGVERDVGTGGAHATASSASSAAAR